MTWIASSCLSVLMDLFMRYVFVGKQAIEAAAIADLLKQTWSLSKPHYTCGTKSFLEPGKGAVMCFSHPRPWF